MRNGLFARTLALLLVGSVPSGADAAWARYHYAPADGCTTLTLKPGQCGTGGERVTMFGTRCEPCPPPHATCVKTFRHPCTGQTVSVPLALPEGTPVIYHRRSDWVIYNYGSYAVEVHFLPDGSVDVIYNSGLFRGL